MLTIQTLLIFRRPCSVRRNNFSVKLQNKKQHKEGLFNFCDKSGCWQYGLEWIKDGAGHWVIRWASSVYTLHDTALMYPPLILYSFHPVSLFFQTHVDKNLLEAATLTSIFFNMLVIDVATLFDWEKMVHLAVQWAALIV